MAALGGTLAVLNLVLIFLPKQPSAEERAIADALEVTTKKMDALHDIQMAELS